MGNLEQDIKQKHFKNEYSKAVVNLFYTSNFFHQAHLELFKSFDITQPQFNILRILRGQYPQAATVNLLIERMLDKSSNASRIVDRLEAKELVTRRQCKDDRRAVDVLISPNGLELLSKIDKALDNLENEICKLSEEESRQLNYLLDKMRFD